MVFELVEVEVVVEVALVFELVVEGEDFELVEEAVAAVVEDVEVAVGNTYP